MGIIVTQNGKAAVKLDKTGFDDEAKLQAYIYDNPESIPLYESKEGTRLLVAAREVPTASGPIDAIGIDQDGEIYCIETKLYKNPDKRLVVAQVLDYGASLWKCDSSEFIAYLEAYALRVSGVTLAQRVEQFFMLGTEAAAELRNNIKENLAAARFHFVVLMDSLHARLKDLVVFVNENSRFDIYAVELECYRHQQFEIVIPKLFGAEVKKAIDGERRSARRRWDEQSFFEHAERVLSRDQVRAIRTLLTFSKQTSDVINWGTGLTRGSFSPRFRSVASRSVFSVFSDGTLTLNFGWLNDDEHVQARRDELAEWLKAQGLPIGDDFRDRFVNIAPDIWCSQAESIVNALAVHSSK